MIEPSGAVITLSDEQRRELAERAEAWSRLAAAFRTDVITAAENIERIIRSTMAGAKEE